MFICGMVLHCAGSLEPGLSLDHIIQLQQIWHPLLYMTVTCW